jgi:hypothetical protein
MIVTIEVEIIEEEEEEIVVEVVVEIEMAADTAEEDDNFFKIDSKQKDTRTFKCPFVFMHEFPILLTEKTILFPTFELLIRIT